MFFKKSFRVFFHGSFIEAVSSFPILAYLSTNGIRTHNVIRNHRHAVEIWKTENHICLW